VSYNNLAAKKVGAVFVSDAVVDGFEVRATTAKLDRSILQMIHGAHVITIGASSTRTSLHQDVPCCLSNDSEGLYLRSTQRRKELLKLVRSIDNKDVQHPEMPVREQAVGTINTSGTMFQATTH
jgi:hypothetical protein